MTQPNAYIAIDCGGTNCRAVLVNGEQRIAYRGAGANAFSYPKKSADFLADALKDLSVQSGLDISDIPIYVSLAGAIDSAVSDRVAAALPVRNVVVQEDCFAAVTGALGGADGYLAGLGTGSFFARSDQGKITHIGGFGLVLGDEASGAWLGRTAMSAALKLAEGRFAESAFLAGLLGELGGRSGLIQAAAGHSPSQFAKLAPRIFEAAVSGDQGAETIVGLGVDHIVLSLSDLGWQDGARLCLTGGLAQAYAPFLPDHMQSAIVQAKGDGLAGAEILAQRMAGGVDGA